MGNPKLSIITINLNNKEGLRKTIKSVVSQTFTDYEYIIIDGSSTDGSVEIIEEYSNNIEYWVSEPDSGIYYAMNKGINQAKGDYCLFLNSGDYFYNNAVCDMVFSCSPQEDIVYGDIVIDYGEMQEKKSSPDKVTLCHLFKDTLWHPVSFIKRKLFETVGLYDTSFLIAGDYDFNFKAFVLHHCSQHHLSIIIAVFNTQGISSNREFEALTKKERYKTQISNVDSTVIDLYTELMIDIQNLKQLNTKLQSKYDEIVHSKTYRFGNLLLTPFRKSNNFKL